MAFQSPTGYSCDAGCITRKIKIMNLSSSTYQIIRGGIVLDVDNKTSAPMDILLEGDRFLEIGPPGMEAPAAATLIDARDRLLMPGLVNAHTHGHASLGKGTGDKWSLELLLNALPWVGGGFTLEDKYTAASLNAAEMVLKGCTAAYDMYFEFPTPSMEGLETVGRAYSDIGLRVVLAPMMADTTLYQAIPGLIDALPEPHRSHVQKISAATAEDHLKVCDQVLKDWAFNRDQVRPALGPTIPLHCSDAFIRECRDMAKAYDVSLQMHLAESKTQAVAGIARYGKSLTAHLEDLDFLSPRFTGAHGIWLEEDDLKRLADHGANIAHNPASNLRLGSGIAPARQMINLDVGLGIGTDGSASSDNQNMFEAMRTASYVSRVADANPEDWLGTWDVLKAATSGGAKVLGMADLIGRIAPGYKADMVFLDLDNINFIPLNNAANQIVNCEDSSAVDSVMIGGRMVLAERKFTDFDYAGLRHKAESAARRIENANGGTKDRMEAMASFVSHHCIGLACQHSGAERRVVG